MKLICCILIILIILIIFIIIINSLKSSNSSKSKFESDFTLNSKSGVNCYTRDYCKSLPDGTGCRTVAYLDGICLNQGCVPSDDYNAYRDALISGDKKMADQIANFAFDYSQYEAENYTPQSCVTWI